MGCHACTSEATSLLLELREKTQKYTRPFDLPEPDDDLRLAIRKIVDHEMRSVRVR